MFAQVSFFEVKFPKTNSSHIADFRPRRADSEEEGILIAAPQKVSARQRGKGSGDGPRYAADRDATFRRWPSMHRKPGRYPSWGSFGSREAGSWPTGRVVRRFFARFPPFTTAWGIFLKRSPRSAQSKLDYSEKWQHTTLSVDHEVAGAWGMAGMRAGSGDSLALPPALSLHSPPHLHPAPPTLFLLRRDRALRPAFAWDRGRVIHLILASSVQAWSALRV